MIGLLLYGALNFGAIANAHLITPTARELEMLNEVNFARTNPKEYLKFIDEYTTVSDATAEELTTAKELKLLMSNMTPVDSLKWSATIYHDAFTHGNWMKRTGKFEHSDYAWAENLVCGISEARYAVIDLLIDAGIESRGHRKNILNANYKEFACYEVFGAVMGCDYVFVQEFN